MRASYGHPLTDEQYEIQQLARTVAEDEIRPHASDWDRSCEFPAGLLSRLARLGLLGVCVPEALGGAGADFLAYILVLEELSRADAGVGVTVAVHTSAATLPIVAYGTQDQVDRLVPPLAAGDELGAFALTEPDSGSDAKAMRTAFDAGAITGTKQWITNGSYAATFVVFAREDEVTSAFLARQGAPGFHVTGEADKMGLHSSSTADLRFDDTPVERLGSRGDGMRIALATLDAGRIGIAAQAVGIAQAALDLAVDYSRQRRSFGRPIAGHQAVAHALADAEVQVQAARALTYRAAALRQAGRSHTAEGAQAKLLASTTARRVSGIALQTLGGYGYVRDFPAERHYRDAKVTEIYEGTSEIQRIVIARALLGDLAS